jgi:uncharacterized membrane protein YgcG
VRRLTITGKALLPVVVLLFIGRALGGIHQVWDQAHLFKYETIQQADEILQEIHDKYHKDLMIETFASIPDDFKGKLDQQGPDKFFDGWAMAEGQELHLNGLLILVCGQPRHIQVALGLATRQKAFTDADRSELVELIQFDKGLLDGIRFVRDRIEKNLSEPSPTSSPATRPAVPQPDKTQKSK